MSCSISEESLHFKTKDVFETLTKLLVDELHPYDVLADKKAYLATVRKRLTELLDQFEQAQQEPPPVEATGRKGWPLYQCGSVVIINPIIFKYHMLEKLEGKETFRLYRKSFHSDTWGRSWHPLLAWNTIRSKDGKLTKFFLFSDDRLAPGDVVVLGNYRWVVTRTTWIPDDKVWCVDAVEPESGRPEATFELDDPKDNTTEVPIYGAPVKV